MSDTSDFPLRPIAFAATVLVIAALLGGCSEGGNTDAATESTESMPGADPASALGACDLLTADEVAAALGGTAGDPKAGAPVSNATVRLTDCSWIDTASGRSITVILRRSESADNTAEAIAGIRAELAAAGPLEDVDGLADGAFWGSDQLHVFDDGRNYLTVSVSGFEGGDARTAARQVAKSALERL
jgi:hypothetical protein